MSSIAAASAGSGSRSGAESSSRAEEPADQQDEPQADLQADLQANLEADLQADRQAKANAEPATPDAAAAQTARRDVAGRGSEIAPATLRSLEAALARLRDGGCVGFPTETVWGLAARADLAAAVEGMRRWKGRREAQPISLLVPGVESLRDYGFEVSPLAERLAGALWPGPLTLVLPCRGRFAPGIAREDGAVGVRCSPHPIAARLVGAAARAGLGPLTATSLNRTDRSPAASEREARALCGTAADQPYVVETAGLDAGAASPSTVLDLTGDRPRVLRRGAVGIGVIERLLGPIDDDTSNTNDPNDSAPHGEEHGMGKQGE